MSADIFYEVYDTLDPDCGLVVEPTRTMRLIGSCFVHPRPTHVSVIEGDNDIEGFLVTCDHPGLNIMGPGAARREEQAAILIHRELNRYRGRQPLFIVPVDCGNLVRMLYGWGARNCELHVSQVRGEAVPSRGVIMPTFLPESA